MIKRFYGAAPRALPPLEKSPRVTVALQSFTDSQNLFVVFFYFVDSMDMAKMASVCGIFFEV